MENASLIISIVSLIVAVMAIIISIVIYKKQQKDEMQSKQDEFDALTEMNSSPFPMSEEMRAKYAKINYLKKQLGKK